MLRLRSRTFIRSTLIGASVHAVVGGPASQVGDTSAGHHCLRRSAALIHAGAAHVIAFDKGSMHACAGERTWKAAYRPVRSQ